MLVRQLAVGALTALALVGCAAGAGSQAESPGSRGSAALSASPAAPACGEPCYADPEVTGSLSSELVVEVSGVAASHSAAGVYYVVGDEPGTDEVVAVRDDGSLVARIGVAGMSAENAEALAVGACGPHDSNPCVFVADIGDHVGRPYVVVYRFQEPDLTAPPPNVVAADALRYSYPDAATDAEALIVDDSGRPLIVSKAAFDQASATTGPTRLYRGDPAGGVLELLGEIDLPTPDRPVLTGIAGNVVTDASSTDGRVLLRTYDQVIEYRAAQAGAELGGFRTWPYRLVPAPAQIQSEAIAYQHDCGYLTISEFTGSIATVGCRS